MSSDKPQHTDEVDEILGRIDPAKRGFLKALVVGSAFVAPIVASFPMEGLSVYEAHAQGGSNLSVSDRDAKEGLVPADTAAILDHVAGLPIATWRYKGDRVRHIGPMAQDFAAAFQVGEDNTHISTVDADGVALAAIQGLRRLVDEKDRRIDALEHAAVAHERELSDLRTALQTLRARLDSRTPDVP